MARLSRNPGFDIRDEPEDLRDTDGPYSHLPIDPAEPETEFFEPTVEEPFSESGRSRRRAAVAVALALTAGATTAVLARSPSATPTVATVETEPVPPGLTETADPAPAPNAKTTERSEVASGPATQVRPPRSKRPADRPKRQEAQATPAPRAPVTAAPKRAAAAAEPAGGEFVLGAR